MIVNTTKSGIVFLTISPSETSKCSETIERQICVGEICIAMYEVIIKRQTRGKPAFGTDSIATGKTDAVIVIEPATNVPKRKMRTKIRNVGIGNFEKKPGKSLIAPDNSKKFLKM